MPHGALGITLGYKEGRFLTQFFADQLDPLNGPDDVSAYWIFMTQLKEATGDSRYLAGIRRLLVLKRHKTMTSQVSDSVETSAQSEFRFQAARLCRIIQVLTPKEKYIAMEWLDSHAARADSVEIQLASLSQIHLGQFVSLLDQICQ